MFRFRLPSAPLIALAICLGPTPEQADAAPILNPANGHYYDVINGSYTWAQANAAAQAMGGHLVTITSAQENQFLTTTFGSAGLHFRWTGGFQPPGSPEPAGGWSWVTGETFAFNNWASPGEPNNLGNEDRIIFDHGVSANGKQWNDLNGSVLAAGFVVEFVPEPTTWAVLAGLVVVTWVRTRRASPGGVAASA